MRTSIAGALVAFAGILASGDAALGSDIHKAAESASLSKLIRLIRANPASIKTKDRNGQLPLHLAAYHGRPKNVNVLLMARSPVDAQDNDGNTPLHVAFWSGGRKEAETVTIVRMLLAARATVDIKDNDGYTPLFDAVRSQKPALVQLLLDHKADVNAKNDQGVSPLHRAAAGGGKAIVSLLLDAGADLKAKAEGGFTALHSAAMNEKPGGAEVAALLLKKGLSVSAKTSTFDKTPLHYACEHGNAAVLRVFLKGKPDLTVGDWKGLTPLHWAASDSNVANSREKLEAVRLLLNAGADFKIKDKQGRTPMMFADMNNLMGIVKELRMRGARK